MSEHFVDTNVFLRYLTDDVPEQAQAVTALLEEAQAGRTALRTSALVIAEIVWTLDWYYELPKEEITRLVLGILNTAGLHVEHGDTIAEAVVLYAETNVDYADAYNACWMRRHDLSDIYTFDRKHFAWLPGVRPRSP